MSDINPFGMESKEAIAYFQSKGLKTSFVWEEMLHEEHSRNFTVAKMLDLAMLADVKKAVDEAIANGTTLETFRDQLEPMLQEKGWWGRQPMADPTTGEIKDVQLGSPRRLKTIFETNLKTAYSRGHWQQIQQTAEQAPYLLYDAVDDDRTREEHLAWDGIVLRWDDPWWKTHYPPNGWNCRCVVIQLDQADLAKLGKTGPDAAPPASFTWVNPQTGQQTQIEPFLWTNPVTGEEMEIPGGIDPGWAYNPGASGNEDISETFMEKVGSVPADLGAEAFAVLSEEEKAILADDFEKFADEVLPGTEKPQGIVKPVGVIDSEVLSELEKLGQVVSSALITISDRVLLHMIRDAKAANKGSEEPSKKDLSIDQIKRLPEVLNDPWAVLWDMEDPALLYVFDIPDEERLGKFVVRVNVQTKVKGAGGKKTKTIANTVVTGGRVNSSNVQDKKRYKRLKGRL
jgi:SPP1 gp7 family putative phage head morphogenesis protein